MKWLVTHHLLVSLVAVQVAVQVGLLIVSKLATSIRSFSSACALVDSTSMPPDEPTIGANVGVIKAKRAQCTLLVQHEHWPRTQRNRTSGESIRSCCVAVALRKRTLSFRAPRRPFSSNTLGRNRTHASERWQKVWLKRRSKRHAQILSFASLC